MVTNKVVTKNITETAITLCLHTSITNLFAPSIFILLELNDAVSDKVAFLNHFVVSKKLEYPSSYPYFRLL